MAEQFINGETVRFAGQPRLEVLNPADGSVIDSVPEGGEASVAAAIASASAAFPGWRDTSAAERGEIVAAASRHLREHMDELMRMLTREQGKPLREARQEITRFILTLEHYVGLAKNLRGGYVPDLDTGAYGLIIRRPLGVIAAIVPWNFPTTLLGNKLGPALICGNTVVAKPAETTPLTTLRIAALMHEAGLPAGVFNVVTGTGPATGQYLVTHPDVRKVAFTGSTPVGKRLATLAAEGLKRMTLELGGSDPLIICDDADLDAAISAASVGRFFNCGQACVATKRLFVFESVADAVIERLVGKVERLRVGPGTAERVTVGPLHSARVRGLIEEQVADAVGSGAQALAGAARPEGKDYDVGYFYKPTLLLEPARTSRVATEEVFGPVLPIWRVRDLDEAIERANDSPFGLGSTIWTRDLARASYAAQNLQAGYTWVNSINKVYDELPFGGWKQSGYGKEHGNEALDFYTETKSVVMKWR